jgi:hypothetical protein
MDGSPSRTEPGFHLPTYIRKNCEASTTQTPVEAYKNGLSSLDENLATDTREPKSCVTQSPKSSQALGSGTCRRTCVRWLYVRGWELSACCGSLIAFISMVALLKPFEGKAQPSWPYGITLNSAVSWLNTIMKGMLLVSAAACISQSTWIYYGSTLNSISKGQSLAILSMYDSASRGPWGSVQLLWALGGR